MINTKLRARRKFYIINSYGKLRRLYELSYARLEENMFSVNIPPKTWKITHNIRGRKRGARRKRSRCKSFLFCCSWRARFSAHGAIVAAADVRIFTPPLSSASFARRLSTTANQTRVIILLLRNYFLLRKNMYAGVHVIILRFLYHKNFPCFY